jgi:hypothetical protein
MTIDWGALGTVFLIALVAAGVITSVFAVGVRGLAARTTARETGASGSGGLAAALICFMICAAVVGYGIYLIAG